MYCINDSVRRFYKTYLKIRNSGLLKKTKQIYVVIVGHTSDTIREQLERLEKVAVYERHNRGSEIETLNVLWQFSELYKNSYVLYLHSKGVTRPDNTCIADWIECMEYFLIERHEDCLEHLKNFDTVGPNIRQSPSRHFSGNFWWAKTSYLNKLKCPEVYLKDRLYSEFWLFDYSGPYTYKCIYDSAVNHYSENFEREKYINVNTKPKTPIESKWGYEVLSDVPSAWKGLENYIQSIISTYNITPNSVLEFGVDTGYSSYIFSKVFNKVIGVDHFLGDDFIKHPQGDDFYNNIIERFKNTNVEIVRSSYQDYILKEDRKFDLIHIDISHTYEDTYACLEWSVFRSDVIIAHDTESFPEVKRAMLDIASKHELNFCNIDKFFGLGILYRH